MMLGRLAILMRLVVLLLVVTAALVSMAPGAKAPSRRAITAAAAHKRVMQTTTVLHQSLHGLWSEVGSGGVKVECGLAACTGGAFLTPKRLRLLGLQAP